MPVPKHNFQWEQTLSVKYIMEDNMIAEEASTWMSNIDNQLSKVYDKGETPVTT